MTEGIPAVRDCRIIPLPRHDDESGSLTVLECVSELPFDVRRAIVITNVPSRGSRGHHANMFASELIVCAAGAVTVRVEDGTSARSIPLSSQAGAVLVPPTLWVELRDFAPETVVVVFADTNHRDAKGAYVRDRGRWLASRGVSRVA